MTRSAPHLAGTLAALALGACPAAASAQFVNTGDGVFALHVTTMRDMPFRTVVRQQYDYSCGSAALATLLRHHYGRDVDEAHVFKAMYAVGDQAAIRQVGFSLLDMKRYLESIGFAADGYKEGLADLQASTQPAIAVISIGSYRHFVVVKGARGGKILVGDPAQGLKVYSAADFAKVWNGVVFLVRPPGASVAVNTASEWGLLPHAPSAPLDDSTLSSFTRDLPPIYQVTPTRVAGQ